MLILIGFTRTACSSGDATVRLWDISTGEGCKRGASKAIEDSAAKDVDMENESKEGQKTDGSQDSFPWNSWATVGGEPKVVDLPSHTGELGVSGSAHEVVALSWKVGCGIARWNRRE